MAAIRPEVLAQLRALPPNNSGGSVDPIGYRDPATGWFYQRRYVLDKMVTDASDWTAPRLVGYSGSDGLPWYQGQRGYLYGLDGAELASFEIEQYGRDWGELLALGFVAAVTGGAAYTALAGGSALGAGGYGIVGGATEPVASIAIGETIAGTVATGTAAAATATGTASTLSTAASVLSPLAKLAAAAAPLLGLAPSGSTAPGTPLQRAPQSRAITPAEPASPLLLLAAGALAFLTLKG